MDQFDSTCLIIDEVPQYFFDLCVVEQVQDLTRTIHRPKKEPQPVIQKDCPWERIVYFTVNGWSVLRDPIDGLFKCWYENWHMDPRKVAELGYFYCCFASTCLATSTDGIVWTKPEYDYYMEDGRRTNVVLGNEDYIKLESTTVFHDPLAEPQARYKMLIDHYITDRSLEDVKACVLPTRAGQNAFAEKVQVEMLYSRDGINWQVSRELPRFGQHGNGLGDCYTVTPDLDCGIYRLYTRAAGMESVHYDPRRPRTSSFFPAHFPQDLSRMNLRRIFFTESADLIHWSRPECILTPDPLEDNLDTSYYSMVQVKVGEIKLGFLNVLSEVANTIEVHLVYSRDGLRWHHLDRRRPWLAKSAEGWDGCMVNISSPPVDCGEELAVFYGGANHRHDWWIMGLKEGLETPEADLNLGKINYALGLAKLRKDGFVSIDAHSMREGVLVTRPLQTRGNTLKLNAACGAGGYIAVEVTDADENILEHFSRSACNVFTGDQIQVEITWNGQKTIDHTGCVRLRFFMRNASLYSFRLCQ